MNVVDHTDKHGRRRTERQNKRDGEGKERGRR